jgi:(1->4)-alpha-D-glucan 1-alpha-D-glucosylmutase
VPDLYQGAEFWDFSLVDPDNRRPVNYLARATLLAQADEVDERIAKGSNWHQRQLKQSLIHRVLTFRLHHPELFSSASYIPLQVEGPLADHVIAYMRVYENRRIVVAALRMSLDIINDDLSQKIVSGANATQILLPAAWNDAHLDLITGKPVAIEDGKIDVYTLLGGYPVALICAQDDVNTNALD